MRQLQKMKDKLANSAQILFILLIIVWFVISIIRVANNVLRIYTQERQWIFLTDDQKREKLFGEPFDFLTLIANKTPSTAKIATFLPKPDIEPGSFYLSQYFLYPRNVQSISPINEGILKKDKFEYLAIYYPKNYKLTINTIWHYKIIGKYVGNKTAGLVIRLYE